MSDIREQDVSLVEQVARELEEDIIFGRLQPGTRLREDALLERFGGSRHFIRQALAHLARSGIVTHERNRGAAVRSFSPKEVREIYDVRELLQRQAAMRIPLPVPSEMIEQLREINADYAACIETGNLRGIHEKNDAFHKVLFSACANPYLYDLILEYMNVTLAIRAKTLADRKLLQVSLEHHNLMIKYLQGTDNWVLAELCVDHVRPSKQQYLDMLRSDPAQ